MRPLVVLSRTRIAQLPELPTAAEAGLDVQVEAWNALFAQSFNANEREPAFTISPVSHHIMHNGPICNQGILCGSGTRTLADFFQVSIALPLSLLK